MEPIAIIGMGCRFPGDSTTDNDNDDPSSLWDFLQSKGDAYSDFPANRLNITAWHHPEQGRPGSFYTRGGCFLKRDPRLFDPSMFGIGLQETRTLDPAQRKLLETVYEAFESSGTPLSRVNGSATGCFVGNFNYDHQLTQFRDADFPEPYAMTGSGIALLSNRVSYVFDLHGPSVTLDTACSSSMYALHLACSAIESGECTAAVVGGSNLILTPECQIFSAALGAVSRSSKCHTFDAAADGYARAEGIGVLYIKKLDQAVKDGDPIRAVIRGTAINANGRTGGITHPDPSGQERAIRRAYQRAGNLDPALTSFFECHGTGTPVGDPLEIEAVGRVFAADRTPEKPLYIGSIKSNIGHCEAASGIAGIMKAVLAIENKTIPPILALNTVNPNVDLCQGRLHIVQESIPWPECTVRRASVNSFGYGGANAHTILEEADNLAPGHAAMKARGFSRTYDGVEGNCDQTLGSMPLNAPNATLPAGSLVTSITASDGSCGASSVRSTAISPRWFLLPISAHAEETLRHNINALLPRTDRWNVSDLAYTLGCRRSVYSHRSFTVATHEQAQKLALNIEDFVTHRARSSSNCRLGFIFPGQGSQWPQMGKELMDTFHVYLESIRRMDRVLDQLCTRPDWTIEQALQTSADTSRVHEAALAQPLVTAVQVAIVDLLVSWKVSPVVSVGHSSGEIAAAYAAGHISSAEAIIIAYARGRAVAINKRKGAMLAVSTTSEDITQLLPEYPTINVACYNSPDSLTLSGDAEPIHKLKAFFDSKHVFARILRTGDNAYHSNHMKELGESYENELQNMLDSLHVEQRLRSQPTSIFVSSVSNSIGIEQPARSAYWRRNLESPVLFHQAVTTSLDACPVDFLIEIGPHASLRGPLLQIIKSRQVSKPSEYLSTIQRSQDAAKCVLETTGTLWAKGVDLDLEAVSSAYRDADTHRKRVIVDLPKYQWQYGGIKYMENRWTREWRLKTHPHHDLLGSRQSGGNRNEPMWRNILKTKHLPWLKDHQIGTDVVFPAAGYLSMAVEAAMQMTELAGTSRSQIKTCIAERLIFDSALTIPDDTNGVEILLNLRRSRCDDHSYSNSKYDFTVTSVAQLDGQDFFIEHAHGSVSTSIDKSLQSPDTDLCAPRPISTSRWYDAFYDVGLIYGPSFQCLSQINASRNQRQADGIVLADNTKSVMTGESSYIVHPTALDAAIQLGIIAAHRGRSTECHAAFMPTALSKVILSTPSTGVVSAVARAQSSLLDNGNLMSTVNMTNAGNEALVIIEGLELHRAEVVAPLSKRPAQHPFSRLVWRPNIHSLTTDICKTLFPTSILDSNSANITTSTPIDILALTLLVQLHNQHPNLFSVPSKDENLSRYQSWMDAKLTLARAGAIPGGLDILNQTDNEREQSIDEIVLKLAATHGPKARLLCHMFQNYPRIFSGEVTGIETAVRSGLLSDLYEHTQVYNAGSQCLGNIIKLISHDQAGLDIFEIGGGTGSATREILQQLRGDSEFRGYNSYHFTDITPSFLAAAQNAFKQYSGVHYATFDMEVLADEQSPNTSYDVVVASNVIHATGDMQRTLINTRRLLKPGGRLALFEIVRPTISWVALLGTFPGVWKGDHDLGCPRTEGPFLTVQMWADILPRCGFSGIDILLDHFSPDKEAAVMLSTAIDTTPSPSHAPLPSLDSLLVVYRNTPSPFCLEFQTFAEALGSKMDLVPLHSARGLSNRHVVCLAEVEQPMFLNCSEQEWAGVQEVLLRPASTVWVTGGDLLGGRSPVSAMINGLITAAHAENGGLRSLALHLGDVDDTNLSQHFKNILYLCTKAANYHPGDDFDYRTRRGVLHTSRLRDDEILNQDEESLPSEHGLENPFQVETVSQQPKAITVNGSADVHDRDDLRLENDPVPNGAALTDQVNLSNHDTVQAEDRRDVSFDPEASYLLVGCLGGLGRSFSEWMVLRGARNLVFLSRSGLSDIKAINFVSQLQAAGVSVHVVQGDVTYPEDVKRAVSLANGQLKGVVQAPLSLKDSYLRSMTLADFNATMRPRVIGTLNLHQETQHLDLKFFMMWSSWTQTLGSASQPNYMASSAFMDAFALHRQALGLPTTSLSLGHILDVGIVSDRLDYQKYLMQMGLYGNSESEFLRFCDYALSSRYSPISEASGRPIGQGHLLAGLEPSGLAASRARYPLDAMHWFRDPRFAHLIRATERLIAQQEGAASSSPSNQDHSLKSAQVALAVDDVSEPLLIRIQKQVARNLYLSVEDIDVAVPLARYGIDSMVAAQFRNWLNTVLGANISLFLLLQPTLTVEHLTAEIEKCLPLK